MILYKLVSRENKLTGTNMTTAHAVSTGTLDLEALAEHMAGHNTPFSKGTIYGVLKDMVACIRELCLEGKSVQIPDLASFSVKILTRAADTEEIQKQGSYSLSEHLKGYALAVRPLGSFRKSELDDVVVQRLGEYIDPTSSTASSSSSDSATE